MRAMPEATSAAVAGGVPFKVLRPLPEMGDVLLRGHYHIAMKARVLM